MSSLRISTIVRGRRLAGTRVSYLLDPAGEGEDRASPETVVLKRWRKRRREGWVYSGARIGPNLWRGVAMVFGRTARDTCELPLSRVVRMLERKRAALADRHYGLPSAETLHALFGALGPERMQRLLDRHLDQARVDRFGMPDLFLFSRQVASGLLGGTHFVEVKKPGESVSEDQKDEIEFLRSLGLSARVLRLIER